MYAGSLASGWKKKKGISARRCGSLGTMMGSVPVIMMLGTIACVSISAPTSTCSSGIQGGTLEQLMEMPRHKQSNPSGFQTGREELQEEAVVEWRLSETADKKGSPRQKMNQAPREEAGIPLMQAMPSETWFSDLQSLEG
jgi:hypothetical protein